MMNDIMENIVGKVRIDIYEKDKIVDSYIFKNLITNIGIDWILKMIGGDATGINRIALGSGDTSPSYNDTKLNNKIILVNVTKDYSEKNKVTFLANIPEYSFNETVIYKEGGLVYKTQNEEILITRLTFDNLIYQRPENSISISYSLEFVRGENVE